MLSTPPGFSDTQPLTLADLEREAAVWRDAKYKLRVVDRLPEPKPTPGDAASPEA